VARDDAPHTAPSACHPRDPEASDEGLSLQRKPSAAVCDAHNPASRANQKDIAMCMQQFFDNKLKGAAAPEWMVKGIAAKDKGKDQINTAPKPITP